MIPTILREIESANFQDPSVLSILPSLHVRFLSDIDVGRERPLLSLKLQIFLTGTQGTRNLLSRTWIRI